MSLELVKFSKFKVWKRISSFKWRGILICYDFCWSANKSFNLSFPGVIILKMNPFNWYLSVINFSFFSYHLILHCFPERLWDWKDKATRTIQSRTIWSRVIISLIKEGQDNILKPTGDKATTKRVIKLYSN